MINELDLKSLWLELDAYEKELEKETSTLQEVWVKIAQLKQKNESDAKEYVPFILYLLFHLLSFSLFFF